MNEQKKLTPELEKRVQQAVENFMQGYGCCQSVVAAFADLYGLDEKMAKRIGCWLRRWSRKDADDVWCRVGNSCSCRT